MSKRKMTEVEREVYERHLATLRDNLTHEARKRSPTIYLIARNPKAGGATYWSAYVVRNGALVSLWLPEAMKVQRATGDDVWYVKEVGTEKGFCVVRKIIAAAGLDIDPNTFYRRYL